MLGWLQTLDDQVQSLQSELLEQKSKAEAAETALTATRKVWLACAAAAAHMHAQMAMLHCLVHYSVEQHHHPRHHHHHPLANGNLHNCKP